MIMYEDSESCIAMSLNAGVFHPRTKHIALRHHYLREQCDKGDIKLMPISTQDMQADILTKPLAHVAHERLARAIHREV